MESPLELTNFVSNQNKLMSILNAFLLKTSSVKKIGVLFVSSHFVLLLMMLYTFPVINNQIGIKAFDLQTFGYSVSEAKLILKNLNDPTIDLYLFPQLTLLDILYPFLLALFLSSLLFRLIKITGVRSRFTSIFLILPFLSMIFDYSENVCIILMISESIEFSETIVLLSSTFTILKGMLTSIAWMIILIVAIIWIRMKMLKRSNKRTFTSYKTL